MTTLIISNKEMKCVVEIVKCLEKPGLLNTSVRKTTKNEGK